MTSGSPEAKGARGHGRRGLVASLLSLAGHAAALALLAWLLGAVQERAEPGIGSYVVVSPEPPARAPAKARARAEVATAAAGATTRREALPRAARPATTEEPAEPAEPEPSAEPSAGDLEAAPVAEGAAEGAGGSSLRSLGPFEGEPEPAGATAPSPECLDRLDNDGDRLVDDEDPECWPDLPPVELVSKRARSLMLQDVRRDDLPEGDPDELARQRVLSRLRSEGDSLVYQDGSFVARIDPDGTVGFGRRPASARLEFDMDGTGGAPHHLQKQHFLDATEEIRTERAARAGDRMMKTALARLGGDLESIWRDRHLSHRQKRRILFERLDECDLESPGGREAARRIIEFIRARFPSGQRAPSI